MGEDGSPDLASTILVKIVRSAGLIADVTLAGRANERLDKDGNPIAVR